MCLSEKKVWALYLSIFGEMGIQLRPSPPKWGRSLGSMPYAPWYIMEHKIICFEFASYRIFILRGQSSIYVKKYFEYDQNICTPAPPTMSTGLCLTWMVWLEWMKLNECHMDRPHVWYNTLEAHLNVKYIRSIKINPFVNFTGLKHEKYLFPYQCPGSWLFDL